VWVYHGTFTTGLAAVWFRLATRARIVFTCADLWPESFMASGVARQGPLMSVLFRYSRAINRIADVLICCTRGTLERYAADGVPADRLVHVPVWVDGVDPRDEIDEFATCGFTIVYAGNLGPSQKLDTLIEAVSLLERQGVAIRADIYGTGACEAKYRRLASELRTRSVHFHGRVTPAQAFSACATASAQYIALQSSPLFDMTVPSKLYAAFAAGTPLLYGLRGEAALLAQESDGGVAFDVESPAALADAIRTLMQLTPERRKDMRDRLVSQYWAKFAKEALLEQYVHHLVPSVGAEGPVRGHRAAVKIAEMRHDTVSS
jgi:colanic acid biosynthesis glycosyl transferase WcaI